MENNAMAAGLYSNMGPGMLGLEMSLQPHQLQPAQNSQITHHHMQPHQPPPATMVGFTLHDSSSEQLHNPQATAQMAVKQSYPFAAKPKNQSLTLSDDEEPGLGAENSGDADGKRKMSPWQRMKWTDNMVRLLIMVVYYIGDEGGSEGNDPSGKKKGAGVLQKKGKWKSVSRAMMERGFYVSPQQCEDKFNDLNKRYKRVNDILGKGTSCKVVENQSLLDTMDHLSAKTKEEVKKLLNSKHLFFREMCAYHNSCGHGGAGSSVAGGGGGQPSQSPEVGADPSHLQQQSCLHASGNASITSLVQGSKFAKATSREEDDEDDDDDNDHDDDEDDDDDDEDDHHPGARGHHDHSNDADDDTPSDLGYARKRQRNGSGLISPAIQRLSAELANVIQDETKNPTEKRQWIKSRLLQLEEQHVGYQSQAFELEKQRLKWVKYSSKKEREMERDKLHNERMRLENERMLLLIRQKEIELVDVYQQQQQFSRRNDPSSVTG